ncbi:MAG: hypothetical protein KKA42_10570, partial [candidate division Zixibacteria bacterium]|nr:hypothetical protein [candidate division Zixibacteria bacterium]
STFGNDIMPRLGRTSDKDITRYTKVGLIISVVLAITWALLFRSVVDIWHAFGSIGTPALLVPVFFAFVGKRRFSGTSAFVTILVSGGLSAVWYLSKFLTVGGDYWLGLQPIFPGLTVSLLLFGFLARANRR